MKRDMEETSGLGQSKDKSDTKGFFIFEIWFDSERPAEAVTDIGYSFIGLVKINTKVICK